ncbi:MAG: tRNA lysidine(34) synthetase TilS [Holophagales bacterium]|jgi:tRNA(Ile)-lysidine synthetase-like protein|nr:tRNA lysidine(34) synthetase TilS [Holophagales bacterium]
MRRFETNLLHQIHRRGDGVQKCSVLIACSGGGDSVALLLCMVALRTSLKLELAVAHVDHGLRPESKEEAEYVKTLCEKFGLDMFACSLDVIDHASRTNQGLEMAARELRWSWLKKEATNFGAGWIATGHTIEDHTETVFLRLARGSGPGCLSGLSATQAPRWSPLIECNREELRAYLCGLNIEWREDYTNDTGFTPRNRWRKHLTDFRAEAPCIDRHLWETHRQISDLLELRNAVVFSWRGTRWDIIECKYIWLNIGWKTGDLAWVLEAAFRELNIIREYTHIFDLADWVSKVLFRPIKRPWKWGNWSLYPHLCGASLQLGVPNNPDCG